MIIVLFSVHIIVKMSLFSFPTGPRNKNKYIISPKLVTTAIPVLTALTFLQKHIQYWNVINGNTKTIAAPIDLYTDSKIIHKKIKHIQISWCCN